MHNPTQAHPIGQPFELLVSQTGAAIPIAPSEAGRVEVMILDAPAPCEITSDPERGGLPLPVVAAGDLAVSAGGYTTGAQPPRLWLRSIGPDPVRVRLLLVWQGGA